ncbi:AMP-dependent synthetase/ligase [Phytomonospora endophytica]|uniref:Acyl-CoA synthetase n=1 Tax=Phytomonospora endophytica TaxID=714109 RepID=A0A841FNM9_9ACTN|nr:AMP-dependent synthetase/ligase [Phytomonospora endophytica]MBB6034827.1 long-chain acyl-CoA synthetase [Phytomonospora endophytica]GIG68969.1 long-chain acyl-CoA synthetase [Phytomonospora endophytica]
MREFSVPRAVTVPDDANLTDPLWANAENHPDSVIFARPEADGTWSDVTSATFRDEVVEVALGLVAAGIKPGDRIGLMSATRYEWTLVDYAIWAVGAVSVPVYETSSADQVRWNLSDSEATACIVEKEAHAETVASVRADLPELKQLWTIESGGLDDLRTAGKTAAADINELRRASKADDLATIIYTSGTTGRPKGCMLSHRNMYSDISNTITGVQSLFHEHATTILFLPLAHSFARIVQLGAVEARVRLGHFADAKKIATILPTFQPTFLLAVPRVFEKVYNGARQKAADGGKGKIFDRAAATAIEYSEALDSGRVGLGLRLRHKLFDKLVYGKLRAALGGRCDRAISGGAPLGERLGHFFRGIGVTIYEGYGLTETSPVISLNLDTAHKVGTVGRPVPNTSARLGDDGELLIKGDQVFKGYWRNQQATDEMIVDGWLHTGDLASIDEDGFLRITGRKKEILVTAGGKNVAPAPMEDVIRAHPLVSQALVIGDAKPFIACLVAIDSEALPGWLERNGKTAGTPVTELRDDEDLKAEVQAAIDAANATVSKAEGIKAYRILPADLTEATGEVTPKQSVKRNVVMEKYAGEIDIIYGGGR